MATRAEPGRGKKPNWKLKMFDKATQEGAEVGAGWDNEDGSINIKLNACVVLDASFTNQVLKLFPNTYESATRTPAPEDPSQYSAGGDV